MTRQTQLTPAIALVLSALLWTAPSGAEEERRHAHHRHQDKCPIPTHTSAPDADCADWQWIGVLKEPATPRRGERRQGGPQGHGEPTGTSGYGSSGAEWACPDAGPGWSVRHLFCPDGTAPSGLGAPRHPLAADCDPAGLPPALRPFCLYRHEDAGEDLAARGLPGLAALSRDCAVVGPMADSLVRPTLAAREAHFLAQAGALPAAAGGAPRPPAVTRLAVLDTSPTSPHGDVEEPHSPHGRSLDSMAERLQGGAGAAGVEVTERLALAYLRFDPRSRRLSWRDEVRGGFFGTLADLAQAVRDEVRTTAGRDLVLNLSIGWQRAHGGLEATVGAMPAAVQAVHAALADAQCHGALIVAAAGNRTWGPDVEANRGALLPGAWEARRASTAAECVAAVGAIDAALTDGPGYRPLLFAAGGVEADGRPLGNSRADFDGEPRLVAFADHAVIGRPDDPDEPTAVMTGSSVAAAVVSAAAATVWARDGDLDPFTVMERVSQLGDDLGRPAGFCLARPGELCARARRVRLRRETGGEPRAVARLHLDSSGNPDFADAVVLDGRRFAQLPASTHPACPPARIFAGDDPAELWRNAGDDPAAALYPCPRWQFPAVDARPASAPQPETNGCSSCGFEQNSPGTAYLEIDEAVRGRITGAVFYVGRNAYSLPVDLNTNPRVKIEHLEAEDSDRIFLSLVVDGSRSATAPLLRVRKP